MTRRIASAISKVFHPIFSPILAFVITALATRTGAIYSYHQLLLIFATISLLTVGLPTLAIVFLKWVGLITHLELGNRSERLLPLIISAIFVWGSSSLLYKIHYPISLVIFFRLSVILVLIATFITLFWKISLHGLGWGIITSIAFIVTGLNDNSYYLIFPITIIISGIVASARLYMGAHTPSQVYAGYALGFVGMFIGVLYQALLISYLL